MALLTLPAGCGSDPQLDPLPYGATILAFGDSLTSGTGAEEGESYPAQLEAMIDYRVVNAGVPGEETAEGLARLPGVLDEHRPRLMILCHGGNDMLHHLDLDQAADNLRAMILLARERGIEVVLLGVPKFGVFVSAAEFYDRIAEELEVPYDGDILTEIETDRRLKADPIHPNAEGYRVLAEAVAELLRDRGAIP